MAAKEETAEEYMSEIYFSSFSRPAGRSPLTVAKEQLASQSLAPKRPLVFRPARKSRDRARALALAHKLQ